MTEEEPRRRFIDQPYILQIVALQQIQDLLRPLPRGFQRLRHYGLLGNRCRAQTLPACRRVLHLSPPPPRRLETTAALMQRLTGTDIRQCPQCHQGHLQVIAPLYPWRPLWAQPLTTGPPDVRPR